MARIPDEQIARIKKEVSLLRLAESQGCKPIKQGKEYAVHCPFHDDKTPSCMINPTKNEFNCFGCDAGGSVIDWVMLSQKLNFREAVVWLQNECLTFTAPAQPSSTTNAPALSEVDQQSLMQRVLAHYHKNVLTHKTAREYLAKRGLDDDDLIQRFHLGFGDRNVSQLLASRNSEQGKAEREALKQSGLLLESGFGRFAGSLVVPVIEDGKTLEVYGRRVQADKRKQGDVVHQYLPGAHAGIWNRAGVEKQSSIILCESLIDAMTLWVKGFKNTTTSYGVHGFTQECMRFFIENKPECIYIAYDRDEAGDRAAQKLIESLAEHQLKAVRLKLPLNSDINEWALRSEDFKAEFNECLLQAKTEIDSASSLAAGVPSLAASSTDVEARINGEDIYIDLGSRRYRVRGLQNNTHTQQLKITLRITYGDEFFIDSLDLYQAKQRQQFVQQARVECGLDEAILKKDLGKLLRKLEAIQEEQLASNDDDAPVALSEEETQAALSLLKDKDLLQRIVDDFTHCGVVGEATNTLVSYLAGVSRKLDKPLAVMIQSTSAAGKSALMDAVLQMMPIEERVQYSAMTGQSLYYLGDTNLKHKILAIAEEEGAENASYALKLLQSEGEITIASTGKNPTTGNLETQSYRVEGPVMLFLTTTAIDIDEELLNRCLVLTVNESQTQTEAIHAQQRFAETLDGLLAKEQKKARLNLHHNAQRLLKPLHVVNPFAEQLTFLSHKTRTRRDHQKYLTLIKSIALLHQYQREMKTVQHNGESLHYIEVTEQDIEAANQLAHQVLGKSLDDLPPQTRNLLNIIQRWVKARCAAKKIEQNDFRFSRRDIREFSGWGNTQVKIHCQRLEDMEYLLVHQGGRGSLIRYQLLYDGQGEEGQVFLPGLGQHKRAEKRKKSGLNVEKSGSSRPQVGGMSGSSRGVQNSRKAMNGVASEPLLTDIAQNHISVDNSIAEERGSHA